MRYVVMMILFLAAPTVGYSQSTWYVPDDFTAIQDALSSPSVLDGDTILVKPGTYVENINYLGKAVTLRSIDGPYATVIDGGNPSNPDLASVVTFDHNEGLDSILDGFTIRNGTGTRTGPYDVFGGGVYAYQSSPMLMNNFITLNTADYLGGGICLRESPYGRISGNVIVNNTSDYQGGGIAIEKGGTVIVANCLVGYNEASADGAGCWMIDCSALIANCLIVYNYNIYWDGAGLWCWNCPNGLVANCNILYNDADPDGWGGGIFADGNPPPITNCIVRDNKPIDVWGSTTVTYSNVGWSIPGAGNINAPPHFADPDGPDDDPDTWEDNDFHIQYTCPCKDAGNSVPGMPGLDWEGDPRKAYGTVDMGCDEFYPHLYYKGSNSPGRSLELKFVGLPGTTQVGLVAGFSLYDPPLPGAFGAWHLAPPLVIINPLPSIPAGGIFVLPVHLPLSPPGPYTVYMQAMIDWQLTNLCTLEVK